MIYSSMRLIQAQWSEIEFLDSSDRKFAPGLEVCMAMGHLLGAQEIKKIRKFYVILIKSVFHLSNN